MAGGACAGGWAPNSVRTGWKPAPLLNTLHSRGVKGLEAPTAGATVRQSSGADTTNASRACVARRPRSLTVARRWRKVLRRARRSASVHHPPQAAQNRAFAGALAAGARGAGDDAVGQPAERQRLQPHRARSAQRGEEQALAAKQRRLHAADELNVIVDRRF